MVFTTIFSFAPFSLLSPKTSSLIWSRRRENDELSSSGYSSAINAEYYPVQSETMDTEDYELYDPRIHAKPRIMQPQRKVKAEVQHKKKTEIL